MLQRGGQNRGWSLQTNFRFRNVFGSDESEVWVGWRDLGADQGPAWLTGFGAEFPDDVTTDVYKNAQKSSCTLQIVPLQAGWVIWS